MVSRPGPDGPTPPAATYDRRSMWYSYMYYVVLHILYVRLGGIAPSGGTQRMVYVKGVTTLELSRLPFGSSTLTSLTWRRLVTLDRSM